MITLYTGGPGAGKTAYLVSQILEIMKTQPYRELFVHGVRELKMPGVRHTDIFCRSVLCDHCRGLVIPDDAFYVEDYPKWYRSHFLIVVDEVQRIWPKSTGAKSDEAISKLQTHRWYGLDFILVSQSPKLINSDVKAMITRHVHLISKWNGRKQFEWSEVQENTQSTIDAVERPYSLPSHVYGMYKSAEVHTIQNKRKPLIVYFLAGISVLLLCAGIKIYYNIQQKIHPVAEVQDSKLTPYDTSIVADQLRQDVKKLDDQTLEKFTKSMTPIVVGVPWSAPIYSELAKPVSFPRVVACLINNTKNKCACFTQQSTRVDVPDDVCRVMAKQGFFDHFRPDYNVNNEKQAQKEPLVVMSQNTNK